MLTSTDWLTARVVHCNGGLWRRDGFQWKGVGHSGACSPLTALGSPRTPINVVIDDHGMTAFDPAAIRSLDGSIWKLLWDNWDRINHG